MQLIAVLQILCMHARRLCSNVCSKTLTSICVGDAFLVSFWRCCFLVRRVGCGFIISQGVTSKNVKYLSEAMHAVTKWGRCKADVHVHETWLAQMSAHSVYLARNGEISTLDCHGWGLIRVKEMNSEYLPVNQRIVYISLKERCFFGGPLLTRWEVLRTLTSLMLSGRSTCRTPPVFFMCVCVWRQPWHPKPQIFQEEFRYTFPCVPSWCVRSFPHASQWASNSSQVLMSRRPVKDLCFLHVMFQIPKPPVVIEVISPNKQETVFLVSFMRNYEIISSVSSTAWTWKLFQLCPQSKWPNYLNRNLDSTLLFSAPGSVAYNQEDTHLVWVSIQEFLKEKRPWKESFCVSSIQGCLSRRDELGGYDRWITNVLSLLTWSS